MKIKNTYFYCPTQQESPTLAFYPHNTIALAEGFQSLGIPIFSNNNYWLLNEKNKEYLFTHDPQVEARDCDLIVLSAEYLLQGEIFPQFLKTSQKNKITVFIDISDGVYSYSFYKEIQHFDIILRGSYNKLAKGYPSNIHPWCFGSPQRIIDACTNKQTWSKRNKTVLCNYRVAHPVRTLIQESTFYSKISSRFTLDTQTETFHTPKEPHALLHWIQTGRRHYPQYFQRLCNAQASACFGGYFYNKKLFSLNLHYYQKNQRKPFANSIKEFLCAIYNKLSPKTKKIIYQWDSFRLWESFAAACLVLHIHFEKYGLTLPVMPKNRIHYIGINLSTLEDDIEFLLYSDDKILANIAKNGHNWMIEQYSPLPMAKRLLTLC